MDYQLVCERVRPKGAVGETTVCYVVGLRADGDPSCGQGFLWKGGGWSAVNVVDGAEVGLRVPEERRVSLERLNHLQKQTLFSELKGYLEPNTARQLFGLPKLKLRLYDRPGTADRYTAVLEGEPVWLPDGGLYWQGYAFGTDLTPRGYFQHVEVPPDADLGRPIALNDLPDDVRAHFLQTLASEFPYPEEIDGRGLKGFPRPKAKASRRSEYGAWLHAIRLARTGTTHVSREVSQGLSGNARPLAAGLGACADDPLGLGDPLSEEVLEAASNAVVVEPDANDERFVLDFVEHRRKIAPRWRPEESYMGDGKRSFADYWNAEPRDYAALARIIRRVLSF